MQTNITGASGKVNYFQADLILTNHRVRSRANGSRGARSAAAPTSPRRSLTGDQLYICSNNGIVTGYKVQTGERVYQQRLSSNGSALHRFASGR